MKKTKRIILAAAILLVTATATFAQKTSNFSGRWELNKAKSSPVGQMQNRVLVIEHNDPNLKVNRTETYADGERVSNPLTLTTDGKLGYYTQFGGKNRQNFQASWEGAKLVIKWNQDRGPAGQETETWTLSANGKTLTITTTQQAREAKSGDATSGANLTGKLVTTKVVMEKR